MKKLGMRAIAWLLTLLMMVTLIPPEALAYFAPAPESLSIITSDGRTVAPDKSWEDTFPYGTFAFGSPSLDVTEGGEGKITLYRLGGTQGRVTAFLTYSPVIYLTGENSANYGSALSADDVRIRVEEALPIAKYQPVGKDPDPLKPSYAADITAGKADENGDVALTLSIPSGTPEEITAWQWYTYSGGGWKLIQQAAEEKLLVAETDLDEFDFRCVYTVGGTAFCSDSLRKKPYVYPEQEVLEKAPADIPLNPEPTYTELEMSADDPYSGYAFAVTFAEGEWVKELFVRAVDDDEAEADEFAGLMIRDCEGGALYDAANTMTLRVVDNEAPQPSELGFAVTEVRADKAAGTAELTVKRTGGTQQVLSIDYTTADGTAEAGKDYAAASGTLAFYAFVDELTIEVPLINDGLATEDTVDFTVTLSNLRGDGGGLCTLKETTATVSLYNTAEAAQRNLATVLADVDAVDVSASAAESDTIAAPGAGTVTGQEAAPPQADNEIQLVSGSGGGDVGVLTYAYPDILSFPDGSWSSEMETKKLYAKLTKNTRSVEVYKEAHMKEKYNAYNALFFFLPGVCHDWGKPTVTKPIASIRDTQGNWLASVGADPEIQSNNNVKYTVYGYLNHYIEMDGPQIGSIGFSHHYIHGDDLENDYAIISTERTDVPNGSRYTLTGYSSFSRRTFDGEFKMKIYTANDSDSAPAGAAVLTEAAGAYTGMQPRLSFADGAGGALSGHPYVGSTVRISIPTSASYFPAKDDSNLGYAVYLTNKSGNVVQTGKAIAGDPNTYTLELVWDGMTSESIWDTYTIHVVMIRKQDVVVDVAPSVPRLTDANGNVTANIDTNQIKNTANAFLSEANIQYGYSEYGKTPNNRFTSKTSSKSKSLLKQSGTTTQLVTTAKLENLQWICFNLPREDKLLYNGVIYNGDAKIYLSVSDLAQARMVFRYYAKEYAAADSVMTTDISQVALYLDANQNGRIDGYYNRETGMFVLTDAAGGDSGPKDEMVMFLEDGVDYDEKMFAPAVWVDGSGKRQYAQYFLKAYYTMTPRNLLTPVGGEGDRAQVLPSFITDVTGSATLGKMTAEQKAYRYIVSGLNRAYESNTAARSEDDYTRSADNRVMYGGLASSISCVDLPLGGDFNQLTINDNGTADVSDDTITWNPDFRGNLLYRFAYPSQPIIRNSLAGSNIPVAKIEKDGSPRGWSYVDGNDGVAEVNDYLGSYTYNDTFALSVQVQTMSTDLMKEANGIYFKGDGTGNIHVMDAGLAPAPVPESTNRYNGGLYENSDYLKVMQGAAAPSLGVDSKKKETTKGASASGSPSLLGGGMPDAFNMDVDTGLPTFELAATDYVTVTFSGYEIGFSIGIPLGGYDSNGDAGTGGTGGGGGGGSKWFGPAQANKSNAADMKKLANFMRSPSQDTLGDMDDSWGASHPNLQKDAKYTVNSFKVGFSVATAFLFKYDPVNNVFCFSQFTFSVAADIQFTIQHRFQFFPPIYVFLTVGGGVELSSGLSVDRIVHEMKDKVTLYNGNTSYVYGKELKKDETLSFTTDIKSFNIVFSGKLYLDFGDGNRSGMIESDGSEPVLIVLKKSSKATITPSITVHLTALEDGASITRVAKVDYSESNVYWNGLTFSPSVFVEAGFGLGVMFFKVEGFVKFNVGLTLQLGRYERKYDENGVYSGHKYADGGVESFELSVGIAVRAVLALLTFEMDLIRVAVGYDGTDWYSGWGAFGDRFGTLSLEDGDGNVYESPIRIGLLGSTADTQNLYSPSNENISLFAYQPSNKDDVPFELSGYGSSGDAFKLADGLITGYDYKVVSVGQKNYVVYTVSRRNSASELDHMMLVLSELNVTSTGGNEAYGLVNPLDYGASDKYLVLDTIDGVTAEPGGDLGFSVWVEGSEIHAAWVSYNGAFRGDSTAPGGAKPTSPCPADMNRYNYAEVLAAHPAPATVAEPVVPTPVAEASKPSETLPAPVMSDYYVDAKDYSPETYPGYTPDSAESPTHYFNPDKGDTLTEAQDAYTSALAAYNGNAAAWSAYNNYQTYLTEKNRYDTVLLPAYQAYQTKLGAWQPYKDWHDYFKANDDAKTDARAKAVTAAKNTVVRAASFDTAKTAAEGNTGFTTPVTVSGAVGSHVFLPVGDTGAVFYAKAEHYDEAGLATAKTKHEAYLNGTYGDGSDGAAAVRAFNLQTTAAQWQLYGKQNQLHASVGGTGCSVSLNPGAIVENITAVQINAGTYYVAYTTGQTEYDSADGEAYQVRRLYLRAFSKSDEAWAWGDARLLRTLVDYDVTTGRDGLYNNSTLTSAYTDPYLSNLQFLHGKIGDKLKDGENISLSGVESETFLLFEMNGACYVIKQDSLASLLSASPSGTIHPFFKPSAFANSDGSATQQTSTGRTGVTIGIDGAEKIAAVYVGSVPNSLNNAVYLTRFDPNTGLWGAGTMLAMRGMQIHEDSLARSWSDGDAEKAYLGDLTGYTNPYAGLKQYQFSNLQIAAGLKDATVSAGSLSLLSDGEAVVEAPTAVDEATRAKYGYGAVSLFDGGAQERLASALEVNQKDTLLVLAQGAMLDLVKKTYEGETILMPDPAKDAAVGVYALSYGIGGQGIGQDTLTFPYYDFSAGSALLPRVSFANTGDVSIRGSKTNPTTVKLMVWNADGASTELAAWTVTENIRAGQRVELSGTALPLTADLAAGSVFYLTVEEDKTYAADAFSASTLTSEVVGGQTVWSGTLTVESKPELGFESFKITGKGVDTLGNTLLDVSFQAGNRGSATAVDVYAQFSYETGTDTNGNPIYTPLDLTMAGTSLTISKEEKLSALGASTNTEMQAGILYLHNSGDGGNISKNHGRTVEGTIAVPPSCYKGASTGSLNLRVELFSSADTLIKVENGLKVVKHGEYNSLNNEQTVQIEHATYFTVADQITLAMGNTLRLPVSVATTTGAPTVVSASEVPASVDGDASHLGILYYAPTGSGSGVVVIAPSSVGDGVIHIYDAATNTTKAVTYAVTPYGQGINIYKDNRLFTFLSKNGSEYDEAKPAAGQTWSFQDNVPTWGAAGTADVPYLGNLSHADQGSKFTFRTVAASMDLYFNGAVKVESTFPGFSAVSASATGGKSFAAIDFGDNATNYAHTVTVTVTSVSAQFDRLIERYASNEAPTPADDANAPQIYWSRSFPDTASIKKSGDSYPAVTLTCYVLDDTGLGSVLLGGKVPDGLEKNGDGFWQFDVTVSGNQTLVVAALDQAGNRTGRSVTVDWFSETVSGGAVSTAPDITAKWMVSQDGDTDYVDLAPGAYVTSGRKAALQITGGSEAAARFHDVVKDAQGSSRWNVKPLDGNGGLYSVTLNGYYQATVTEENGTWASRFLLLNQIDASVPVVTLQESTASLADGSGQERQLVWSVRKDSNSVAPITAVTLNGYPLTIRENQTALSGVQTIRFAGGYEMQARDSAGNQGIETLNVANVPVTLSSGAVVITPVWNQAGDNGSLSLDISKVTGGLYDSADSKLSEGKYQGSYEYALVPAASAFAFTPDAGQTEIEQEQARVTAFSGWLTEQSAPGVGGEALLKWKDDTDSLSGLTAGDYILYVRDAQDKGNAAVVAAREVTVGSEKITVSTAPQRAMPGLSNGAVYVTAAGGRGSAGVYQFAILPLAAAGAPLAEVSSLTGWKTATLPLGALNETVFSDLAAGSYQIGVRAMAGVTAGEMNGLSGLYTALTRAESRAAAADSAAESDNLTAAVAVAVSETEEALQAWLTAEPGDSDGVEAAYKARVGNTPTVLAALAAWRAAAEPDRAAKRAEYDVAASAYLTASLTAAAWAEKAATDSALTGARTAYETELSKLGAAADAAYSSEPGLWTNAATVSVRVEEISYSDGDSGKARAQTGDLTYDEVSGTATLVLPKGVTELSAALNALLISQNSKHDVLIRGNGLRIRIPTGTLSAGDDVGDMIVRNTGESADLSGCVVVYTDANGTEHVVMWSSLDQSGIFYIASAPGSYRIVEAGQAFDDVPDDYWGFDAIRFAAARGLFRGTGGNRFDPNGRMTRGMFVTVLGRLAGIDPARYTGSAFQDVNPEDWYGPYVQWAAEHGIVLGNGSGGFGADDEITREQICAIIARFLRQQRMTLPVMDDAILFSDQDKISGWASEDVAAAQRGGLIQGKGDGSFDPLGRALRAEVAAILQRLIQSLLK